MDQRTFYNRYVRPHLKLGRNLDRPYNRMLFSTEVDQMHRAGKITDRQAQNWVYPDTNAFLAPSERRSMRIHRKKRGKR